MILRSQAGHFILGICSIIHLHLLLNRVHLCKIYWKAWTTYFSDPRASQSQPEPSKLASIPAGQTSRFPNSQPSSPSASVNYPTVIPGFVVPDPALKFTVEEQPKPLVTTFAPKIPQAGGAAVLKSEDYVKAIKYCKFASSALQFEDAGTAIENLSKALNLLINGHE